MQTLRIKKGDLVKVIAGGHKGKTGKVERVDAKNNQVFIENIGKAKRHVKPSQLHPRGGSKEIHNGLPVSNLALIIDEAKGRTSKVGYSISKDGKKTRTAKATRKEIA
jgi:large subunit ribosomal protein L24